MGRVIRIADRNYVLRRRDWTAMLCSGCLYANETKRPTGCTSERMDGDGTPGKAREKANGPAGTLYAANPSPAERGDGLCS